MADRADRPDDRDRPDPREQPTRAGTDPEERLEPENPALTIAARHALHDEELVAAFATDGEAADDAARARGLVERCQACSSLHADLVAIGSTLRATPDASAFAATVRAPRDFRLSVETANRLRPGSVAVRLRDRIRDALAGFSRPLGMSMASLGVVGLLLGTLTLGGTARLGSAPEDAGGLAAAGPSNPPAAPGTTAQAMQATNQPGELTAPGGGPAQSTPVDTKATGSPAAEPIGPTEGPLATGTPSVSALVVAGSVALIVAGVALLLLGRRGREPIPAR